jgi:hypothetical protein
MGVYGLSLIQPSYNMICKDLDVLGGEFMHVLQSYYMLLQFTIITKMQT